MANRIVSAILGMGLLVTTSSAFALKLGVLAPRGELEAVTRWEPLARHLGGLLGESVELVPLPPARVLAAAESGELDIVLSHPGHAITLEDKARARHLATLNDREGSHFAGVIVARRDSNIRRAGDLRGKTVLSLAKSAAGAYVFQAYHLLQQGIDVEKDLVRREGKQQDDLVLAVKAGLADAAFVRSGVLETMAREGKIRLAEFVVVDQRHTEGFPYLHTTTLYPEWYVTALPGVSEDKAARLKSILLALSPNDEVCKAAKIRGFVEPYPLETMREALRALKLPPYDK